MTEPRRHSPRAAYDGEPRVHSSARLRETVLGRFCEIAERCVISECMVGDYSYFERDCEAIYTTVGKFCAIASGSRLNALMHPLDRVSQHKITYRPNEYFVHAKIDKPFREKRKSAFVKIGHDVWVGHGAIIMPGIEIGTGAVVGAGAVVTKSVAPYEIVAGVPARRVRWRFIQTVADGLLTLAWWDWPHDKLALAVPDMQAMTPEAFLEKWS